jgi:hypothetical protein
MIRASPGGRGLGAPAPVARIEVTSAARNRLNATAQSQCVDQRLLTIGGAKCQQDVQLRT